MVNINIKRGAYFGLSFIYQEAADSSSTYSAAAIDSIEFESDLCDQNGSLISALTVTKDADLTGVFHLTLADQTITNDLSVSETYYLDIKLTSSGIVRFSDTMSISVTASQTT